ncbi:MAG: 2,4-dihydroxyacetophenone dioxygenase [Thermoleophilaceae bacterium]|nr:2,4-dihydroxyacetophenone dioxygenase [Thermoleophilaceae bacterium]
MSISTAPVPAATSSGSPLPIVSLPQAGLLTVNETDVPRIENALGEGIHFKPLRLDLENNEWVVLATFEPGAEIQIHYHTGPAEVYTLQGRWMYKEYQDQPQTPGSYLYEPGGSVHTFFAPADNTEDTIIFVRVAGSNINFSEDGSFHSILDAISLRHITDTLSAEQGLGEVRYLRGGEAGYTT